MMQKPFSLLLKELKREQRFPRFSPANRKFQELLNRTPHELHDYLEERVFGRGDITSLQCHGDDCAHVERWKEDAGFLADHRVAELFNQKISDLRHEIEEAFSEIVAREAEVVTGVSRKRGVAEAIEYIDGLQLRAFVV